MKYKLETYGGDSFDNVALRANAIAIEKDLIVEFDFNGVLCFVKADTNLEWLYRDYSNSWTMGWKQVGPNCVENYSKEIAAEFAEKKKVNEEKQAIATAEYKAKEEKERLAFEETVKGVELELKDSAGWNASREKNKDAYGKCALDYAEGWAKLMQVEIASGKSVRDCAEPTSYKLGFFGITGFMYGCAVSILSQTWKHGEDLRKWHNKEYNHEGAGVVNPAILSIPHP